MTGKNIKNIFNMKNIDWRKLKQVSKILLFTVLLFGCKTEPQPWSVKSTQQVISEYVETNTEFSEFNKILEDRKSVV